MGGAERRRGKGPDCYHAPVRRLGWVVLAVALSVAAAGCGGSSASSSTTVPQPAGPVPSPIATMVCRAKVSDEVNQVLGVDAVIVDKAWVDHRYSCTYQYPDATLGVSVKELSSWAQTEAYFNDLAASLGKTSTLANLGQGAFQTRNGSVVVRKDWKVLEVDPTGLPAQFGKPPTSRADVAVTVADVILGCWDGD